MTQKLVPKAQSKLLCKATYTLDTNMLRLQKQLILPAFWRENVSQTRADRKDDATKANSAMNQQFPHVSNWNIIDWQKPILDLREEFSFEKIHAKGSTCIPSTELEDRVFELPPRGSELQVVANIRTLEQTWDFFVSRGYHILAFLDQDQISLLPDEYQEKGRHDVILWQPCKILGESIDLVESRIQGNRTALDLASGSGRDAVFLAMRGWHVVAVDNSETLLKKGLQLAQRCKCSDKFSTCCLDLEATDNALENCLPKVNLIHVARYLHRPLFKTIIHLLHPGGIVVYHTFTRGVEAFGKPRRPRFILEPNELAQVFHGFQVLEHREDTLEDGRPVQMIVAQKALGIA